MTVHRLLAFLSTFFTTTAVHRSVGRSVNNKKAHLTTLNCAQTEDDASFIRPTRQIAASDVFVTRDSPDDIARLSTKKSAKGNWANITCVKMAEFVGRIPPLCWVTRAIVSRVSKAKIARRPWTIAPRRLVSMARSALTGM